MATDTRSHPVIAPLGRGLWRPRLGGPPTFGESLRIERVIGVARLLLAILALIEVRVRFVEPGLYGAVAYLVMVFFVAHAIAALLVLRSQQEINRRFTVTTSTIDMTVAAATLPMDGPLNAFVAFVLFVLVSTAFRWGLRETLMATAGANALVLIRGYLAFHWHDLFPVLLGQFDLSRLLGQVGYLSVMGVLLGFVAEEVRLLRVEAAALAALLANIRVDAGVVRAVSAAAKDIIRLFNAARLMLVLEHVPTKRVFRWDTEGGWSVAAPSEAHVQPAATSDYLFEPITRSLGVVRYRWPWRVVAPYRALMLDQLGRVMEPPAVRIPKEFLRAHPFRRLLAVPVRIGNEWSGRIFLFDPHVNVRLAALTRFLQTIIRQVSPSLFNVHLQSQLQERAGALERARVARELHDGVIQSLIGVEMQLDVLRQHAALRQSDAAPELARIQRIIHDEVLNVRELMQQMRPVEFDPDELLDYLADMVHRFGRDTGITSTFHSDLTHVQLPWRVCFELVRIVQEGLVNVRKHSAATEVDVRFGMQAGAWSLEITDNGRGFPADASGDEPDANRRSPAIIKERVKTIGGRLNVVSAPGQGTRLEIRVPQEAHG